MAQGFTNTPQVGTIVQFLPGRGMALASGKIVAIHEDRPYPYEVVSGDTRFILVRDEIMAPTPAGFSTVAVGWDEIPAGTDQN